MYKTICTNKNIKIIESITYYTVHYIIKLNAVKLIVASKKIQKSIKHRFRVLFFHHSINDSVWIWNAFSPKWHFCSSDYFKRKFKYIYLHVHMMMMVIFGHVSAEVCVCVSQVWKVVIKLEVSVCTSDSTVCLQTIKSDKLVFKKKSVWIFIE